MTTENETEIEKPKTPEGMVAITVDGADVVVPEGTNVLEAAKEVGVDISAFCYHPGLSIAACCRQCLVSIDGVGKLQPSCQNTVREGMVVHTKDERSTVARKQMLEFTLLNHPIDCPICDKAGECTLQKNYFENNNEASRVDVVKVRKPKVVDLGPTIVLDAERCILCTRCIRVCDEVAGEHQLEMSNRGDHEELGTAPGAVLDNPYSLNTVDVCPVGALTSKDFRFTMRAWELMTTDSVCTGCSTGCNVEVHHKDNRVWRIIPRHNAEVNDYWMCDEGRTTYKSLKEGRLATPTVDGLPAKWDKAIAHAASLVKSWDAETTAVLFSAKSTNEDNFALASMAETLVGAKKWVVGTDDRPHRADDILRDKDTNANRAGAVAISGANFVSASDLPEQLTAGGITHVIGLGIDLVNLPPEIKAIAIASHDGASVKRAEVSLPSLDWAEVDGTIVNRKNMVQRLRSAVSGPAGSRAGWRIIGDLAKELGKDSKATTAEEVFKELSASVDLANGAAWGGITKTVQLRFSGSRG